MESTLEARLKEIVGTGNNMGVYFSTSTEESGGKGIVSVVLMDLTLVEIPVLRFGSGYLATVGDEKLRVYPEEKLIRVIGEKGKILAKQQYTPYAQ